MTSGLEELIAGISRSPRSASTTPKASSSSSTIAKITKNNLQPPPSTQSQSQDPIPEEEEEAEDSTEEMEHKHDEPEETKELKRTAPVRKAKRHLRQEQERVNSELSLEFLNKQFPKSRVKRVLKRGGATACTWGIPKENKMGIMDIIHVHALARVARLINGTVEVATQKQYNNNGDPIVSCDKDDPSKIDDATKHNFKIRLQDVLEACSTCNAKVYSDELFNTGSNSTTTKQNKGGHGHGPSGASASAAAGGGDAEDAPASKKQKV
jgi:hypothetical protein